MVGVGLWFSHCASQSVIYAIQLFITYSTDIAFTQLRDAHHYDQAASSIVGVVIQIVGRKKVIRWKYLS